MAAPILVTGGTGTLGRHLVPLLRVAGRDVRTLSRSGAPHPDATETMVGDLETGAGLDAALAGIEVVVHLAGSMKGDAKKAENLVAAAKRAGTVSHIVNISVVGAGRVPMESGIDRKMFGYYAEKGAAERIIAESGIPWTTMRATQFHDLLLMTARQMTKLPLVPVPAGVSFQPVDAGEVASRLAALALGEPQGLVSDFGGPAIHDMRDLIKSYLVARGKRRLVVPVPLPGKAAQAIRAGVNLAPENAVGRLTWEQFLATHVGASR